MGLLTDSSKEADLREKVKEKRQKLSSADNDSSIDRGKAQEELGEALEKLEEETGETSRKGLQLEDESKSDLELLEDEESDSGSEISFETDEEDNNSTGIF
jgi:hypothetical protein